MLLACAQWEAMEPGSRETTVFFWANIELKNCLADGTITGKTVCRDVSRHRSRAPTLRPTRV